MKKLLCLIAAAVMAGSTLFLSGCSAESEIILVSIVYETYYEPNDTTYMMVLTPSAGGADLQIIDVDGAILPESNAVNKITGAEQKVKVGDVIVMYFDSTFYIRQDTPIKVFTDGPSEVVIVSSGVDVEKGVLGFTLNIPLESISGNPKIGENLFFYSSYENSQDQEKSSYRTVIAQIQDGKASVLIPKKNMLTAMNCMGLGVVSA